MYILLIPIISKSKTLVVPEAGPHSVHHVDFLALLSDGRLPLSGWLSGVVGDEKRWKSCAKPVELGKLQEFTNLN
jgi:hypothetical protein